jgi:protein-S-isoprenylcysteine O-methyltransferase Ste14
MHAASVTPAFVLPMTSEVMAFEQGPPQTERYQEVPMKFQPFALIAVFAAFTIYTAFVVADQGYLGFVELAMTGGWAAQIFIDLCIALILFALWMFPDARAHGIPPWPYFLAILSTGSIGALAYLIHRTAKHADAPAPRAAQRSM